MSKANRSNCLVRCVIHDPKIMASYIALERYLRRRTMPRRSSRRTLFVEDQAEAEAEKESNLNESDDDVPLTSLLALNEAKEAALDEAFINDAPLSELSDDELTPPKELVINLPRTFVLIVSREPQS